MKTSAAYFTKIKKSVLKLQTGKNCMKFFLQGLCNKSCPRAQSLTKEDEKKFEAFAHSCREGAGF
jgi:hypothetical protein